MDANVREAGWQVTITSEGFHDAETQILAWPMQAFLWLERATPTFDCVIICWAASRIRLRKLIFRRAIRENLWKEGASVDH